MDNHCVVCGAYLADTGRMVCEKCEKPKKAKRKTCGDCIHADVCKKIHGSWFSRGNLAECTVFKDEANLVEVVRCNDCEVPHNKWTGCPKLNGLVPPPDFYCAYGERKDNERKAD